MHLRTLTAILLATPTRACSNFLMPHGTGLSGRTMDLGSLPGLDWELRSQPAGAVTHSAKLLPGGATTYGYLGVVPLEARVPISPLVLAGLNEKGLSCDVQTLITSEYPRPSNASAELDILYFCEWALGGFADTDSVRAALLDASRVCFTAPKALDGSNGQHMSLRDASGRSLVVEWVGGEQHVYQDLYDDGKTGWGLMTNEPEYPWLVRMVQHFEWKQSLARPSTSMPGAFYPDERFLRLHLVRKGLPPPKSPREALMQAAHVLNVVTVPPGAQMGTDSGAGEGQSDHTMWGVIYDHRNATIYWRTSVNANLGRVRLGDLPLAVGSAVVAMPMITNALPWFEDAADGFSPPRRA